MIASENIGNDGVRILIVEDSPTQAEDPKYVLEAHGYRVPPAASNYAVTNRPLRITEKVQIGVHILLGGEPHFITADRQQILDLLISTYEEAVHLNDDLKAREEQLAAANLPL